MLLLGAVLTLSWSRASAIAIRQNFGTNNTHRTIAILCAAIVGAIALGAIYFVITLYPRPLIHLFARNASVVAAAEETLGILRWGLIPIGIWQVLMAVFEAIGRTALSALLFVLADCIALIGALVIGGGSQTAVWALTAGNVLKLVLLCSLIPFDFLKPVRAGRS